MLFAFTALSLAVGLGGCLAAGKLYRAALLHGAAGLAGVVGLGVAITHGTLKGPFAWDAVVLGSAAFAGGLLLYGLGRTGRARPALLVLLHGMAGGLAYLLLAGFVFGR